MGAICCVLGLRTITSCLFLQFVLVISNGKLQVRLVACLLVEASLHDNVGGVGGRLHGAVHVL